MAHRPYGLGVRRGHHRQPGRRLRLAALALPQAAEVEIAGTFGQFEAVGFVVEVAYLAILPLHEPPHFGFFRFRVDQHVMGHAFRAVKIEFDNFIPAGSLGRDDFENQVRGAGQPFTFRLVADHQHVGSDDGVLRKFHIYLKHRMAVRAIVEQFVELPKYGGAYLLMIEAGRRDHCHRLAVNQLPITFPLQVILHRVGFGCWALGHSLDTSFVCKPTVKAKQPQKVGDVLLTLKKSDVKKNRFTIELIDDDKKVEKKDKSINEPLQFYTSKARQPYEIVINEVSKDLIVGYLATPKVQNARN